jgi:transposase InsO family protein
MTGVNHYFDNAAADSWFGTIKNKMMREAVFETRKQAETAIFEFIEVFDNRVRLHSSLGYLSPMEFEDVA